MACLAHSLPGSDRTPRRAGTRRTITGLLTALTLTVACADGEAAAPARDDDPEALHQAATECTNSSLVRLWLRFLQLPDACEPTVPTTPSDPTTRTVTSTTPSERPASPPIDPTSPVERDGGPRFPSAVALPEAQPWQPPPVGPVPDLVGAARPEQDQTFPDLGTGAIDVNHYDLDFAWDAAALLLDARATLTLTTREELGGIPLDFGDQLHVTGTTVSIGGSAAAPAISGHLRDKLVVSLSSSVPAGTTVVISVRYQGEPDAVFSSGAPIPAGWTVQDDGAVGTVSEPDAAHAWYPCNDHPTDKATYRTRITVPANYVGVGNGVQLGSAVNNPDGSVSYSWLMDAPMAPYLALVAIADLTASEQGTSSGVRLRNFVPRGQESRYAASLAVQPAALDFLVQRLGPFPFREYGAVIIPGPRVALETQGRSIFQGDSALDVVTVVHELAHQWMGNSVSLTRWQSDIWWVEGFARYSEWLWLEQTEGPEAYEGRARAAYDSLAHGSGRRLTQMPSDDLFGPAIYDGGALVYHELRRQLGEPTFFAAMRAFCTTYRYANATSDDLLRTFSEHAGTDVTPWISTLSTGARLPPRTF